MKKFSQINYTFENKKYKDKIKNDIYSLIKENLNINLSPILENQKTDLNNINISLDGTNDLVSKINDYLNNKIIEERIKVLESVKTSIATGTLSLKKINEEIENCECSEICAIDDDMETETSYIDDYDEEIDMNTEFVVEGNKINLSNEFIKLVEEGKANDMTWDSFFDMFNIPDKFRTNFNTKLILDKVREKKPNLF